MGPGKGKLFFHMYLKKSSPPPPICDLCVPHSTKTFTGTSSVPLRVVDISNIIIIVNTGSFVRRCKYCRIRRCVVRWAFPSVSKGVICVVKHSNKKSHILYNVFLPVLLRYLRNSNSNNNNNNKYFITVTSTFYSE